MMSKPQEELALRKAVLQARAALYRLEIRQECHSIAQKAQLIRTKAPAILAWLARSRSLALALQTIRRKGVGPLLALASGVLLFVKMTKLSTNK